MLTKEKEKQITDERISLCWFNAFAKATDEKEVTENILSALFSGLSGTTFFNSDDSQTVLYDIGPANGDLTSRVCSILDVTGQKKVRVYGIEHNSEHTEEAQTRLNGVAEATIVQGDGFADPQSLKQATGMDRDGIEKADIVMTSHSLIYAHDKKAAVEHLLGMTAANGIMVAINKLTSGDKNETTEGLRPEVKGIYAEFGSILHQQGIKHQNIPFFCKVHFPEVPDNVWERMALAEAYDAVANPYEDMPDLDWCAPDKTMHKVNPIFLRNLLEFTLARPLEP